MSIGLLEKLKGSNALGKLSSELNAFNIFRTLGVSRRELTHSNLLAWLLNPKGSHGLRQSFAENWFRIVVGEEFQTSACDWNTINVEREFDSIDILVSGKLHGGKSWVLCIENKIDSRQGEGQLERYFERTRARFKNSEQSFYVLLTREREDPEHDAFVRHGYDTVVTALKPALPAALSLPHGQQRPDPTAGAEGVCKVHAPRLANGR